MSRIRLLSVPLVGIAAMIIASESIAESSVMAVINASLATIRPPIEGTLTLAKSRLRSSFSQGEPLGEIDDSRADGTRLHDLERTTTDLTAELAKTEQCLAMSKTAHVDFGASASRYQEARIQQLAARLDRDQAGLEAANARLVDLNNNFVRAKSLSERGIHTVANLDRTRLGSARMWLKDLSGDGVSLRSLSAGEPAFCCTSN
jgi:multidrug resistance efflux pump